MCTSTLQTRLLQTLDTLDTVTTNFTTQLSSLESLLNVTQSRLLVEQQENLELKDVILVLLENVERCNGILKGWPYAKIKVTGQLANHVEHISALSTKLPTETHAHSASIIAVLRDQLSAEREAHRKTKTLVTDLQAKLARREAELQTLHCNDTTDGDISSHSRDIALSPSRYENILGSPLELRPMKSNRIAGIFDSSSDLELNLSETFCNAIPSQTGSSRIVTPSRSTSRPQLGPSSSLRGHILSSSGKHNSYSTISPDEQHGQHGVESREQFKTYEHAFTDAWIASSAPMIGRREFNSSPSFLSPDTSPLHPDQESGHSKHSFSCDSLLLDLPSRPIARPGHRLHLTNKDKPKLQELLNLRRRISEIARDLEDVRESTVRISAVASGSNNVPLLPWVSPPDDSVEQCSWAFDELELTRHQDTSTDVEARSNWQQHHRSDAIPSNGTWKTNLARVDDDLSDSTMSHRDAEPHRDGDAGEKDWESSIQSMELCSPVLPIDSNPFETITNLNQNQDPLPSSTLHPIHLLHPYPEASELQLVSALDEVISPLSLAGPLGTSSPLEAEVRPMSTSLVHEGCQGEPEETQPMAHTISDAEEATDPPLPIPPPRLPQPSNSQHDMNLGSHDSC